MDFTSYIASSSVVVDSFANGMIDGVIGIFSNTAVLGFVVFILVWSIGKKWIFGSSGRV